MVSNTPVEESKILNIPVASVCCLCVSVYYLVTTAITTQWGFTPEAQPNKMFLSYIYIQRNVSMCF